MNLSQQYRRVMRLGAVSAMAAVVLSACGGGGGGTGGSSETPASRMGILTDDPIVGVLYTTRNGSTITRDGAGFRTGADGSFEFTEGETVSFKIGGVEITVPAVERVTPVTIAEALFPDDPAKRDNAVTNLSVLFQSLDSDGDPNDGKITVRSDVNVNGLGTQPSELLAALEKAPQTFATDLQSANAGNDKFNGATEGPVVVDPQAALIRFYRNELMGAWQASKFVEDAGVEVPTGLDTSGDVMSFDKGCQTDCELPGGRIKVAFLHHASYDLESSEPGASAAVGVLVYVPATESSPAEFRIQPLNRFFSTESGTSASSVEEAAEGGDEAALFASTLKIEGNQIVLTHPGSVGAPSKPKSIWSRLANQRDALGGAWVEILVPDDAGLTNIMDADAKAQLSFAPDVSGVFYYFLSPTRALISVTDIGNQFSDERNGTILVNYTFNAVNRELRITGVVFDGVTVNPEDPFVSVDDLWVLGPQTNNQTQVVVTDNAPSADPEDNEYLFRRILSLTESNGAFAQPMVQAQP